MASGGECRAALARLILSWSLIGLIQRTESPVETPPMTSGRLDVPNRDDSGRSRT
jgi:hypothetical protein